MPDSNLADGSYLTSAFYNSYIRDQVVVTCTSGTRPTGVEGRIIYETDTDLLLVYDGSTWRGFAGPSTGWASYTPTVSQGASTNIAKTVNYSKYTYCGARAITWNFKLTLTAGGTAGSAATVTLPATSADAASIVGAGAIYDASTATKYSGIWQGPSTTTAVFGGDWAGTSAWGATPNLALATNDEFVGSITFEF